MMNERNRGLVAVFGLLAALLASASVAVFYVMSDGKEERREEPTVSASEKGNEEPKRPLGDHNEASVITPGALNALDRSLFEGAVIKVEADDPLLTLEELGELDPSLFIVEPGSVVGDFPPYYGSE
jgi:hypothetical protein